MKTHFQRQKRIVRVCVAFVLLTATRVGAQEDPADVLQPAAWSAGVLAQPISATPVVPDFERLDSMTPDQSVLLQVSTNSLLSGVVERVERRSPTRYSIIGSLDDDELGFFILVVEEDAVAGLIHAPMLNESYRLGHVTDGVHALEPIDGNRFGECETESEPTALRPDSSVDRASLAPVSAPDPNDGGFVTRGVCAAPPRHFDAMIYYTTAARMEAGGVNAMNAECQLAVDTANVTYANSGIPARMVLVFRGEITYGETGNFGTDRDRLKDPSDGHMDNVHGERNTYGADFVSLFVSDAAYSSCGKAYCLPEDSSYGFCVVDRGCASSNFTFPHEIGHLQGCAHNREDAGGSGCSYYCDSYGHRFFSDTGAWRTTMSYNDSSETYTRIGWFSNPLIDFGGVPTGASGGCDTGTNNAGTIFGTTASRENWRIPRFEVWVGTDSPVDRGTYQEPWPIVSLGVAAIYGGGATPIVQPTLWIKEGAYDETLTVSKPMTIRSCGGIARIGGL